MASAKAEAKRYLGKEDDYINLAGLNKERTLANQVYNTNRTAFENTYNDLLNTIATNRDRAKIDFGSGRSTINEDAFMRNRENTSDLASRGLSGGLSQLSKVGNRMETGRQYSNLANTYYRTMNELDATQRTGENEYNTNLEQARNTLEAALADIGAREKAGRNQYRAAVAQLAEQIQARRDAAAAAAYQNRLLAQQAKSAKNAEIRQLNADLLKIAGTDPTEKSYKAAIKEYRARMGGTDAKAADYLNSIGIGRSVVGAYGPQTPWVTPTKSSSTAKTYTPLQKALNAYVLSSSFPVTPNLTGAYAGTKLADLLKR